MNEWLKPEALVSIWLWGSLTAAAVGIPFYFVERRAGAGVALAVYTALGVRLLLPVPAPWGALPPSRVWTYVLAVMATGAVLTFLRLILLSWRAYRLTLRHEVPVPERASAVFVEARRCVGVRYRPPFIFTGAPFPAMAIGVIRPLVVMPRHAANCPVEELKHVVYHELTHLKKGDLIMNAFWQIAASLHWFNPVLRLIVKRQRFHTEARCDELSCRALGNAESHRVAYSRTLLDMAAQPPHAEGALCLSESQYNLSARVERLLAPQSVRGWPVSVAAMLALLASALIPLLMLKAQQPEIPPAKPVGIFASTNNFPRLVLPPNAAGEQPMQTREMTVNARIRGLHAEVETTLAFHNPNVRQLEGELVFPLPDGAVVSGYALDVNGTLVDGVVVKKEKARVAFETETRTRVDPGLVEHVKGNIYRTRIYPLPPNGTRTVKLRYVTELTADARGDVALHLGLPRETIGALNLKVQVDNPGPAPEIGGFGNLRFTRVSNAWLAETSLQNTLPGTDIFVSLPRLPKLLSALERDDNGDIYFTLSDLPPAANSKPQKHVFINIAWDASRSRADADIEKELAFIQELAKQSGARAFTLTPIRDSRNYSNDRDYDSFDALKSAIEKLAYDGGTSLNLFPPLPAGLMDKPAGPWFLFTDGIDTLNDALPDTYRGPVTAIVSQSTADREALRQLTNNNLIDLQRLDTADAVALALNPPRRVTGLEGSGIADVQGLGALVSGRVMLTGRLTADAATLRVTYSDGTRSDPVKLDKSAALPGRLLATVWASGRITRLAVRPEQNEDELLNLGRRFSLVSPATSLIVLESLDQYLRHDIEPPAQLADMRRQWHDAVARRGKSTTDTTAQKFNVVLAMWQRRVDWWEGKIEPLKKAKVSESGAVRRMPASPSPALSAPLALEFAAGAVSAMDMSEESLDDATVLRQGQEVVSFDSSQTVSRIAPKPAQSPRRPAGARDRLGYYEPTESSPLAPPPVDHAPMSNPGSAKTGAETSSSRIQITAWNPDTPYLTRLRAATQDNREAIYLDEAKTYAASPAFFLDCADFFLQQGDKNLGLRILSNLAELRIEDSALLRVYAWRLQQAGDLDRAIDLLRRVTRLRPEDPQSWRDLALALIERGKATRSATDLSDAQTFLKKVIFTTWNRTPEIELFALEELNALMDWITRADWPAKPALIDLDPRLRKNLDLDLRVVMSWDADATDIDLHVLEPSGEEAYYGHNLTSIRGLVSRDITDGYGPEEYLLRSAPAGAYTLKAKYFGSRQQTLIGPATLAARVFTNWGRPDETSQTLTLRLTNRNDMLQIGKINIGATTSWSPADLATLRLGTPETDILQRLGKPSSVDANAWLYTTGARHFKLLFDNHKLLRILELLPGNAEMIILQ